MVQTLLGYTAELAGLVISPGGVCIMLCMPIVGVLIGKVDPRYLICWGFLNLSLSMVLMHTLSLESSFTYIMWVRVYQASGLAFLFIPINTISYTGVPRAQNNDVSGLTNLARNIGGSVGTAFVATMLSRGSQRHEAYMTRHLAPNSGGFIDQVNRLKPLFHGGAPNSTFGGGRGADGVFAAQGFIYQQLHRQSAMLAYMDIVAVLAVFCFLMIPLVLMIPHIAPPKGGPAMH
jgi:DHA2 family multidrug resistance protein